ncbi:MAG TPA: hypothetical protein VLM79_13130 [Kofleriaceae bacterium]|nr:hypothetical protein [Kofleriaceae bacterium]
MALVVLVTACSTVLGFKEAKVSDAQPETDAAVDAPIDTAIDGSIDAAVDAPIDTPSATCVPANCPFGCDTTTDACKDGKLWIFRTAAAFPGNGFGGTDNPIDVRAGSTAKCAETHRLVFNNRPCDADHMLAILHVSSSDSIPLMAGKYRIPTTAPVHEAQNDVLIANNWNDLTDPNKALRAAVMPGATDDDSQIWTGANTVSTCTNWTSAAPAVSGTLGFANRAASTWIDAKTLACDSTAGLMCICWDAAP